jgi:hypothetical protein
MTTTAGDRQAFAGTFIEPRTPGPPALNLIRVCGVPVLSDGTLHALDPISQADSQAGPDPLGQEVTRTHPRWCAVVIPKLNLTGPRARAN